VRRFRHNLGTNVALFTRADGAIDFHTGKYSGYSQTCVHGDEPQTRNSTKHKRPNPNAASQIRFLNTSQERERLWHQPRQYKHRCTNINGKTRKTAVKLDDRTRTKPLTAKRRLAIHTPTKELLTGEILMKWLSITSLCQGVRRICLPQEIVKNRQIRWRC
jgi:hypothetical protein